MSCLHVHPSNRPPSFIHKHQHMETLDMSLLRFYYDITMFIALTNVISFIRHKFVVAQ